MVTTFRILIALDVMLLVASITAGQITHIAPALVAEYDTHAATNPFATYSAPIFAPLLLLSWAGLYVFWRPARVLYCLILVWGVVAVLFDSGPMLEHSTTIAIEHVNFTVAGVMIAMAYCEPTVTRRFGVRQRHDVESP